MPLRISRRPQAIEDAIEIYDYIAERSPAGAVSTLRKIDRAVQLLAENPDAGRSRPELMDKARSFPAGPYLIFYVHRTDELDIVRIVHSAREITADIFED